MKAIYVSRADTLMHAHTLCTHSQQMHTIYQLAVGVNCVGPRGKNNIAPKTERRIMFYLSVETKHSHVAIIRYTEAPLLM